ncbi:right-handed parallel beta-helix repeat-containing protein [Akkermansiaceae bacterium]|nr:right-handed parallel beta-helix repeat-containing protein [Akkermansiaceae bacterium]
MTAAVLLALGAGEAPAAPHEIHVAVDGADTNPGTAELPVATLEKARDLLRQRKADGLQGAGAVVRVHAGTYLRTRSFGLDKQDGGTAEARIVYQAEGTVRLVGGRVIAGDAFRPVSDPAVKARLPEAARDHVVELDLEALGIRNAGPFPELFRDGGGIIELFIDGERLPLARWPDVEYTTIESVLENGSSSSPGTFRYRGGRPGTWGKAVEDGLWLKGFWRVPWQPETVRVAAIDPQAGTVTHARGVGGGIGSKYSKTVNGTRTGDGKENWYALNLLEELDRAGEWCLRFPTKMLYLWPPRDLKGGSALISDMKDPLVRIEDAGHVTFRGFTLEGGLGNGVEITGASEVLIAGCEIHDLGGTGIILNGGIGHRVAGCDIHQLGQGGIYVGGGDRMSLTPAGHVVLNNHIHHIGQTQTTYAPAIMLGAFGYTAVGCRLAHNLIHDLPHAAVLYGGNDHIIEYNQVWRIALDSGDVGAFYTTHDWTSRGNVLRHNLVADTNAVAFYMDDGDSGDTIRGNIAWNVASGVAIGGGHDNIVEGNVFIRCKRAVHLDDRGVARGYTLEHKQLGGQLAKVRPSLPPWSERYPGMLRLLKEHPELPTGNRITRNVMVECETRLDLSGKEENRRFSNIADNRALSLADAGLKDGEPFSALLGKDLSLTRVPGFEVIPTTKMGLCLDEFRKTLPPHGGGAASPVE